MEEDKILTPESFEKWLLEAGPYMGEDPAQAKPKWLHSEMYLALATAKAACERLARVESCKTCGGHRYADNPHYCTDCMDRPGKAHKDWKEALLKLEEIKNEQAT